MRTTRRALFGTLLGAGATALTVTAVELTTEPVTSLAATWRPVICGWPTDLARGLMPCVLAPHHPGACLPAPPPTDRTTLDAR
jgi:hypothetical protein